METHERSSAGFVIQQLLERPQAFNLFQAISLLEQDVLRAGHQEVWQGIHLRFHASLAFEPSDVRAIEVVSAEPGIRSEWQEDVRTYVVRTSVLGLTGAGGPLPLAFTEMLLAQKAKREHASTDFLDIFNQRFLYFLYSSRRKHHAALGAGLSSSAMFNALDSIGSLGQGESQKRPVPMWFRHTGLFAGAPRSMTGLLALLRDRLGLRVSGKQFVGQWLPLGASAMTRLGRASPLSGQSVLGRRVWDQAAGIELEFDALNESQLRGCLPGGAVYRQLQQLIAAYMRQEITVRLVLRPSEGAQKSKRLCVGNALQLGWSSWLQQGHLSTSEPVRLKLAGSHI